MKTSEQLRKFSEALAPTIGNRIMKQCLTELVDEVVNLELERDDAIEDERRLRELFEDGGL